jgi:hypothetical protein
VKASSLTSADYSKNKQRKLDRNTGKCEERGRNKERDLSFVLLNKVQCILGLCSVNLDHKRLTTLIKC